MTTPNTYGTFDPNTPSVPLNRIRLMIGDTADPFIISDSFILLSQSEQIPPGDDGTFIPDIYFSAVKCLEVIAGAYSQLADKTVGDLSITYRQQYQQILDLIDKYQKERDEILSDSVRRMPGVIFSGTAASDAAAGWQSGTPSPGIKLQNDPTQPSYWT